MKSIQVGIHFLLNFWTRNLQIYVSSPNFILKYPIVCELVHGDRFFKVAFYNGCILSDPEIIGIKY